MLMEGLKEFVEYGVIGLLLGLSVWAIGVAVERWLFYRRVDIRQFPTLDLCEVMLTRRLVVIGTVRPMPPISDCSGRCSALCSRSTQWGRLARWR